MCEGYPREFFKYVDYTKNLGYEENPDYDMLKQLFSDVIKNLNEKMDYIYDWTTKGDLKKRKQAPEEEEEEEESEKPESEEVSENKRKKKKKDIDSNNNDQIDRLNSKQLKREITKEDKVESVCCIVYVYILYNYYFIYSF